MALFILPWLYSLTSFCSWKTVFSLSISTCKSQGNAWDAYSSLPMSCTCCMGMEEMQGNKISSFHPKWRSSTALSRNYKKSGNVLHWQQWQLTTQWFTTRDVTQKPPKNTTNVCLKFWGLTTVKKSITLEHFQTSFTLSKTLTTRQWCLNFMDNENFNHNHLWVM